MTLKTNIKKRNVVVTLLGLYLLLVLVQQNIGVFRSSDASWSIGTLLLPGNGEVIQSFAMPVSGAFRVSLLSVKDGSATTISGAPFDGLECNNVEERPAIDRTKHRTNSPEMEEHYKVLSAYNSRKNRCWLDGQYGVVEIELLDVKNNSVDTRLSSNMYHVNSKPTVGKVIADFRQFDKGVELQLTVRSSLSDSHINRERRTYNVMVHPNRLN